MTATAQPQIDCVTAVTVTYHSRALVSEMAETLRQFREFVMVDNASGDDTLSLMAAGVPHGTYIANAKNTGFGAAINLALRHVKTEFALLLNPDCRIAAHDVQLLVDTARTFESAILIGPQVLDPQQQPQVGTDWDYDPAHPSRPYVAPTGTTSTKWLSGCCLLVRVEPFIRMGGFDERFFMYFEEFDICRRAVAQGGDCLFAPAAVAWHKVNASSTPSLRTEHIKMRHYSRSKRLLLEKYGQRSDSPAARAAEIALSSVAVLLFAVTLQGYRMRKWMAKVHSFF